MRAKLLTPDWSSRENTCYWLAEHAIPSLSWFLHFVPQQQRVLSGSLEFDFLSRIVHAKNTWKSSAKAKREFLKVGFFFLTRNSKRLFVSKAKNVIGFVWLKNWNHSWPRQCAFTSLRLLPRNNNRIIITVPRFLWEEGAGQIQWKKYSASSLFGPMVCCFYFDLCSCDFQAVESFTVQVNQLTDA